MVLSTHLVEDGDCGAGRATKVGIIKREKGGREMATIYIVPGGQRLTGLEAL